MSMDTSDPAVIRALRRLTIAVWALVVVVAVSAVGPMIAYVPWLMSMWTGPGSAPSDRSGASSRSVIPHERFHEYSVDEKIAAASVIATCKYQKDGDKLKCVIAEVLKRSPNTDFYFKVGDEYPDGSRFAKADVIYGDGQLIFFVGNPAQARYSTSIFGDRLGALGDMPIELLRRKIKGEAK